MRNIKGFEPMSLCDWKGVVSAVLFLGGCNWRCPTCHNWDLATSPGSIESISLSSILEYLRSKKGWIDGVVISGGEPTLSVGLPYLVSKIKAEGFAVNLHTNGTNPDLVRYFLDTGLVDVFSVDVKGPWDKYPTLTGNRISSLTAQCALEGIFRLNKPGRFYYRTTMVPELSEEDFKVCESYLPEGEILHRQEYREPIKA